MRVRGIKSESTTRGERSLIHLAISLVLKIILKTLRLTHFSLFYIPLIKDESFSDKSCNIAERMYFPWKYWWVENYKVFLSKSNLQKQMTFICVLIKIYWASIYRLNYSLYLSSEKIFLLLHMWLKFKSKNIEICNCGAYVHAVSFCDWSTHSVVWK